MWTKTDDERLKKISRMVEKLTDKILDENVENLCIHEAQVIGQALSYIGHTAECLIRINNLRNSDIKISSADIEIVKKAVLIALRDQKE